MYNEQIEEVNFDDDDKKNINKKKYFPIFIVVLLIIGVIIFYYLSSRRKDFTDSDNINYSSAFFIKNKSNNYALFTSNGNKVTDFIFSNASDFINGSALVVKDNKYGIINKNGKMLVNFGKYKKITSNYGYYIARTDDDVSYFLNSKGSEIYNLEDVSVESPSFSSLNYAYVTVTDEKNKTFIVLNPKGQEVNKISLSNLVDEAPTIKSKDNYLSIYYNKHNYIVDIEKGVELASFNTENQQCFGEISTDESIIILSDCQYRSGGNYPRLVKNKRVYDLSNNCDTLSLTGPHKNNILCRKEGITHLLDDNLNLGITVNDKVGFMDNNNYVIENETAVDFYVSGKLEQKVECRRIDSSNSRPNYLYSLSFYSNGSNCMGSKYGYEFYKPNGEKAFDKVFKKVKGFSSNGLAIVSEDNNEEYLLDTKGNKISDNYYMIDYYTDYYLTRNNNRLYGILNNDGSLISDCVYNNIKVVKYNNKKYAIMVSDNSESVIYNISDRVEILKLNGNITTTTNYLYVKDSSKTSYYTYSGKMFYEE